MSIKKYQTAIMVLVSLTISGLADAGSSCLSIETPLADQGTSTADLVILEGEIITSLDLSLAIEHEYVGDLTISLTHLDTGTRVVLIDGPGEPAKTHGCGGEDMVVTLDDDARNPVENACGTIPAINGILKPNGVLNTFAGETTEGTWRLEVMDSAGGDRGALVEWCLIANVTIPGDLDNSGGVDAIDLAYFEYMFNTGDLTADFNDDGVVDAIDLAYFEWMFNEAAKWY